MTTLSNDDESTPSQIKLISIHIKAMFILIGYPYYFVRGSQTIFVLCINVKNVLIFCFEEKCPVGFSGLKSFEICFPGYYHLFYQL